jgi:phage shock protein PspC (stress-responsive transcriptional regulator)
LCGSQNPVWCEPVEDQALHRTNRKLAGVCGGLTKYLNPDATVIRVLFMVLALLGP